MNQKTKIRLQILKIRVKILIARLTILRNNIKILINKFKINISRLIQKFIILKLRFRMFLNNLMFLFRIPAIIILGILVPILALFNLFNIREMLIKIVKGEITKQEQQELYPKFLEVINHTSCIFYILLLYFLIWF